ncbi:MAG: type II toxin-antitoxin system Phd/YefM family antitoxin [Burkholderiales bacterium]|nr:type II toxin-antitoxin system Phd/YefM family antitoxin [Burkholderiales bacterium]
MAKTLPISEVKMRLPELIAGVQDHDDEIVVTKNGRPAAVLINYEEYGRLKETLDVLSDPDLMAQINESRQFYAAGNSGGTFEDVFGDTLVQARKRRG